MPTEQEPLSLELERYLLGQLAPEQVARLRERLGEARLAELVRMHAEQADELFAHLPPLHFKKLVEARARSARPARTSLARPWLVPALVAAVAVLGVVSLQRGETSLPGKGSALEETRAKGLAPTLLVFRRSRGSVEQLSPSAQASPGDVLQLGYVAAGRPYGVIVSLDGAGAVTLHGPAHNHERPALEPQGKHMLETAYELDAAPRFERFVLVTSERPFELDTVLDAAERKARQKAAHEGALPLPAGLEQTSFLLQKVDP